MNYILAKYMQLLQLGKYPTNSLILIKILSSSFTGQLLSALESKVKHAQCFDVALMDDGSVVLASKDYRLYIYRYVQLPPMGMLN